MRRGSVGNAAPGRLSRNTLRRKLLILAPFYSDTPFRGYEKLLLHHLNTLPSEYEVDLITLALDGVRVCDWPKGVRRHFKVHLGFVDLFCGLFSVVWSLFPIQCWKFLSPAFSRAISKATSECSYDYVLCYMVRSYAAVPPSLREITTVFGIDPLTLSYRFSAAKSRFHYRIIYLLEAWLMYRLETRAASESRRYALITARDAKNFRDKLGISRQIDVVRYGCDVVEQRRSLDLRDKGLIVVTGNGSYAPNVRALSYLLEEVWPIIRQYGNFRLEIIGGDLHPNIVYLASRYPDISVVGHVPSVSERISEALASLCLTDLDVGVQTKLLESMACGTPAICSRAGANGLDAVDGEHFLIAESAKEVAIALKRLQGSDSYWELISLKCYEFVRDHHKWSDSSADLKVVLTGDERVRGF
jgi:glycosyltransferase involved in cell wall biosynthesis